MMDYVLQIPDHRDHIALKDCYKPKLDPIKEDPS